MWWDVRPHPTFGTVELRICDGIPTLKEVGAIGAIVQCLVQRIDEQIDAGVPVVPPREWTVRQNKWLAARYGLDAKLIVDDEGDRLTVRVSIRQLGFDLLPTARTLGCERELNDIEEMLVIGSSYTCQRAIVAGGGSLRDVVTSFAREFLTDTPGAT